MTTTTHPDVPLPAGVEFYEEWHQSPNERTHYRRFATKKFPVFAWLTVHTGGTQLVQDDGQVFVIRDVRIMSTWKAMLGSQAQEVAPGAYRRLHRRAGGWRRGNRSGLVHV
jgi:hypothetical protein